MTPSLPMIGRLIGGLCGVLAGGAAMAQGAHGPSAHVHGLATIEVVQQAQSVSVQLSVPQEAMLGHERIPRTAAEKKAAAELLARLRSAAPLVQIDASMQCRPVRREVQASRLEPAAGSAATGGQDEHADVDLAIEHQCAGTAALRQLDLGPLLDAFKGIARLEARIVTPAGQFKATLKRPARVLAWGR